MSDDADDTPSRDRGAPQSPIKQLLSGSAVYGLGTILVQTVNILLMPILTAHLSTSEYGAVAILNFAGLIVSAVFSLGVGSSVGICYFEKASLAWRRKVIGTAFGLMTLSSVILVIGVYLSLNWSAVWLLGTGGDEAATLYAALAAAITLVIVPFDSKLRLDGQAVRFTAASFASTFAIGGLTLWFVIELERGVAGYFEALVLGRALSFSLFYAFSGGLREIAYASDVACQLLRLGAPIMPQFLILYFLQYGNIDLIKRLSGLPDAGIYAAGLAIGLASNVVVSSIGNAWAPFFLSYSNRQDEAREMFGRATKYYILGVGLFSLLFYYCAKPLMIVLSAPEYFDGYRVVGPVATAMFMLGLYNMLLPPVYFAKEVGRITYNGIAAIVVQLIAAVVLIPKFGILGAAWTSVCAYSVYALLLYLLNISQARYFRIRYQWSMLTRFGVLYVLSCLGFAIAPASDIYVEIPLFIGHFILMLMVAYKALDMDEIARVRCFAQSILPGIFRSEARR